MRITAGNTSYIKKLNRRNVLSIIRRSGVISRASIVKTCRLTASAVAEITKLLEMEGLILEEGVSESTGGRPSFNYKLNPQARYAVGCDFNNDQVTLIILDFEGKKIAELKKYHEIADKNTILDLIADSVLEIIEKSGLVREQVLGVGISIPGLVNMETGDVYFLTHYDIENIDIRRYVEAHTGITTWVVNDANAAALAEYSTGAGRQYENLVCVISRRGIGAGVILNGRLFGGSNGVAGEIGHQSVDPNGPRCNCGNYGCLEVMSGTNAIIRQVRTKLKQRGGSAYFASLMNFDCIELDQIIEAAKAGDELILSIFRDAAIYLGIGLASVINFFNPQAIILSGDIKKYYPFVEKECLNTLGKKTMKVSREFCKIELSSYGSDISAIGAGELILTGYFNGEFPPVLEDDNELSSGN